MVNKFVFTTNLLLGTLVIINVFVSIFCIGELKCSSRCPVKKDKTQKLTAIKDILQLKIYESQKPVF